MSQKNDESNVMICVLAGVGLGAIIGAAAGLLFAPKPGSEIRDDLADKFKELKGKTEEWITEQKAKRSNSASTEEVGV